MPAEPGGTLIEPTRELGYWLALSRVSGLGAARLQRLVARFGSLEAAWHSSDTELLFAGLPRNILEDAIRVRRETSPEAEVERLRRSGVTAYALSDPDYPTRLRHIPAPPAVLFCRGSLLGGDELAIAVVGTRKPTGYGLEVTRNIVSGLVAAGVTIISGLALGVDGMAHQVALERGGRTLAVLGSGVDVIYPRRHERMAREIAETGAVLSEYPLGTLPDARNFPPRNRIISGLSHGVLVVEAGERSGALITAQFALDQDRDAFAVPGSIYAPMSQGPNHLIQRGEAKLVTCADDILEELPMEHAAIQAEVRLAMPEGDTERAIISRMTREPRHIDEIGRDSGLPAPVVAGTLALLELKGLVRSTGGMSYVLVREAPMPYTAARPGEDAPAL